MIYTYKDTSYSEIYSIFFGKQQTNNVGPNLFICLPKRLFFSQCMITSANMEICPIDYFYY